MTKLVILGISLLTAFILALREALVAKLVILGISPLTSFILALREALLVAKLVISGILNSLVYFSIYQYLIYLQQILN